MSELGRPSEFTQDIADRICDWLIVGKSLTSFCKQADTPSLKTVYNWLEKYPDFLQQYARARDIQQDVRVDIMMDIADSDVNDQIELRHNELRIDTIKWTSSKLKPKKYGNLIQSEDVTPTMRKLVIVTTDKDIITNEANNHPDPNDRE